MGDIILIEELQIPFLMRMSVNDEQIVVVVITVLCMKLILSWLNELSRQFSSVLTMNDEMNIAKRTESDFPSEFSHFHEIDIF